MGIFQALQVARKSSKSEYLSLALQSVEKFVSEGSSLSEAFHKTGFFPPLVVRMIKLGEQTSALDKTLLHVKEYFDRALKRKVDHMVGLLEPFMVLIGGLVLAWIAYSVFLPLYDTFSSLDY